MKSEVVHDGPYLRILWDASLRIVGLEWKETTAVMSSDEFKAELLLFASWVEAKRAHGILVDVSRFRHTIAPDVQQWRLQNISTRYSSAGVRRFAFLFPLGAQIPEPMNQSSPQETFLTRAFDDPRRAEEWLQGPN